MQIVRLRVWNICLNIHTFARTPWAERSFWLFVWNCIIGIWNVLQNTPHRKWFNSIRFVWHCLWIDEERKTETETTPTTLTHSKYSWRWSRNSGKDVAHKMWLLTWFTDLTKHPVHLLHVLRLFPFFYIISSQFMNIMLFFSNLNKFKWKIMCAMQTKREHIYFFELCVFALLFARLIIIRKCV